GYGSTGPYKDKKAYDLLVQCEAGLVSITGTPETPSKVGISAADIAAGMYAYSGILATLLRREDRRRRHARHLHARSFGRVDGLPGVLRGVRGRGAEEERGEPRRYRSLRPLRVRRRGDRVPRYPERAGVGEVLRAGARKPGIGGRRTVRL
ncbi:MAG TPA: CoA transferase, partial [Rubrobacteraceae bacterium]|nr:CoA transferase [Rubrobacteraceae bacterium]